jgi:hypothetical protein
MRMVEDNCRIVINFINEHNPNQIVDMEMLLVVAVECHRY